MFTSGAIISSLEFPIEVHVLDSFTTHLTAPRPRREQQSAEVFLDASIRNPL